MHAARCGLTGSTRLTSDARVPAQQPYVSDALLVAQLPGLWAGLGLQY
jgi:hypothetical protein